MQNWTEVGPVESVPQKGSRVMTTPDGDVAIFGPVGMRCLPYLINVHTKKGPYHKGLFTINVLPAHYITG